MKNSIEIERSMPKPRHWEASVWRHSPKMPRLLPRKTQECCLSAFFSTDFYNTQTKKTPMSPKNRIFGYGLVWSEKWNTYADSYGLIEQLQNFCSLYLNNWAHMYTISMFHLISPSSNSPIPIPLIPNWPRPTSPLPTSLFPSFPTSHSPFPWRASRTFMTRPIIGHLSCIGQCEIFQHLSSHTLVGLALLSEKRSVTVGPITCLA